MPASPSSSQLPPKTVRDRARARADRKPKRAARRGRPVLLLGAVAVVVALAVGGLLIANRPVTPAATSAPTTAGADVTPVALPTFGTDAPQNVLDATAPEILTPTPGVAGPTAVVITRSPWQVLVSRGVVRDLIAPSAVAVDAQGNVYVSDFENNFVEKFSPDGRPLLRFGEKGNAPGQFAGPSDLALDADGNLYVADTNNQRIQKLTTTGKTLGSWGSGGDKAGQFWLPSGVAVDGEGKIYVADRGNHRIQVLSRTGQPLAQWGTRGPAPGQFWAPSDVAVDDKGQVYVADTTNERVQVMSNSGQPIAQWGWEGTDPGQFSLPSSVAVDASGNVYVSDTRNGRVQKLSSTGQPLAVWGTVVGKNTPPPAPDPGTFNGPGGLAVDSNGALYVADTRNARIEKLAQ